MKKSLRKVILLVSIVVVDGCNSGKEYAATNKYLRWVDDIEFDPLVDDKNFRLCNGENNIIQYFNNANGLEYSGEKLAIIKVFRENYDADKAKKESGLIRIRFIVNCQGRTDRFRLIGMDEDYNIKQFDKSITNQLLEITQGLSGWKPKKVGGVHKDYYQYLIFKIHEGNITKILP